MKTSVALGFGAALVTSTSLALMAQAPAPSRTTPDRQQRYRIGVMERVLEGAVEHGAAVTRDRLQAFLPADMLLSENAHARGFRLEGYGMFFDVSVPDLEGTVPWTFRALDQNNLGLDAALRTLRSYIESASPDTNVQQALKRIELQVAPVSASLNSPDLSTNPPSSRPALTGSPAPTQTPAPPAERPPDPILENPQEAYRAEVRDALMDAMLEYSRGLGIAADEWLTIAARRNDERPRLSPADSDARTTVIKAHGTDLAAFLGGQLSREEARKRMEVRVF
jgi:hypothetical protein